METVFLSISNMVIRGCREVLDTQIQDHSSSYWDYWQESWCPSKHSIHTRVRWAQPTSKQSIPPHRTFHGPSPSDDSVQPFTTTESHWEKQASTRMKTRDREPRRKPAVSTQRWSQDGPQACGSTHLPQGRHLGGRDSSEQPLPLLRLPKKPLGTQDTRAPLPYIILPTWRRGKDAALFPVKGLAAPRCPRDQ